MYHMMLADNYEELSRKFADFLIKTVTEKEDASIVIATGTSPLLGYRMFVKRVKEENIDISKVTFIKLDEWAGLSGDSPATCEYFIRQELLIPLHIAPDAYIAFDCETQDKEKECDRIKHELQRLGHIDLAILGVGKNGHLGLNEPSGQLKLGPHTVVLEQKTKTHSMLKKTDKEIVGGITLGIGDLFAANRIVLLITGDEKQEAIDAFMDDFVSTQAPVTLLKLHQDLTCIAEKRFIAGK